MNLGERVKQLRKAAGLSQPKLAMLVGIKQPSLSYIENNPSNEIKQETLLALAKHLNTTPSYLSTGKGISSSDQPHPLDDYKKLFDEADMSTRRMILSVLKSLKINDNKTPSPSDIDEQSKQVNT